MISVIQLFKIINPLVGVLGIIVGVLGIIVGAWGIWQWYETKDFNEELQKKLNNSEMREISFQKELSIARDNVVQLKNQLALAENKIQDNLRENSEEYQATSREEFENTNFRIIELKKALNDTKIDLEKKDRILTEARQAQNLTLNDLNNKDRILNEIKEAHEITLADLDKKNKVLSDTNEKIVGISTMLNEVNASAKDNPSCKVVFTKIIGINRELQNSIANLSLSPTDTSIPSSQPPNSVLLPPSSLRIQ